MSRITIPTEYRDRFKNKVYITRWKDHSVLLLSKKEYRNLLNTLNAIKDAEKGLKRFMEAGISDVLVREGQFSLPKWALEWIGSENLKFSKNNQGFLKLEIT